MVPMRAASNSSSPSSKRVASSPEASARAASIAVRRRSFISPAAFSVNVTETIWDNRAFPVDTNATMRPTSAVVFPVPAAASPINVSSKLERMASRAS